MKILREFLRESREDYDENHEICAMFLMVIIAYLDKNRGEI